MWQLKYAATGYWQNFHGGLGHKLELHIVKYFNLIHLENYSVCVSLQKQKQKSSAALSSKTSYMVIIILNHF